MTLVTYSCADVITNVNPLDRPETGEGDKEPINDRAKHKTRPSALNMNCSSSVNKTDPLVTKQ